MARSGMFCQQHEATVLRRKAAEYWNHGFSLGERGVDQSSGGSVAAPHDKVAIVAGQFYGAQHCQPRVPPFRFPAVRLVMFGSVLLFSLGPAMSPER